MNSAKFHEFWDFSFFGIFEWVWILALHTLLISVLESRLEICLLGWERDSRQARLDGGNNLPLLYQWSPLSFSNVSPYPACQLLRTLNLRKQPTILFTSDFFSTNIEIWQTGGSRGLPGHSERSVRYLILQSLIEILEQICLMQHYQTVKCQLVKQQSRVRAEQQNYLDQSLLCIMCPHVCIMWSRVSFMCPCVFFLCPQVSVMCLHVLIMCPPVSVLIIWSTAENCSWYLLYQSVQPRHCRTTEREDLHVNCKCSQSNNCLHFLEGKGLAEIRREEDCSTV